MKVCAICGTNQSPIDMDHIRPRAQGAGNEPHEVWPLCRHHHQQRHRHGLTWIIEKYPHTKQILQSKGWDIQVVFGKNKLVRMEGSK